MADVISNVFIGIVKNCTAYGCPAFIPLYNNCDIDGEPCVGKENCTKNIKAYKKTP